MLPYVDTSTINILHFEDLDTTRLIVEKRLSHDFDINYYGESTLRNLDMYLTYPMCENFDVIICDYCLPDIDASQKLYILSKCSKNVIFYTCLSEKDFCQRVDKVLGYMPFNFRFINKNDTEQFNKLVRYVDVDAHS